MASTTTPPPVAAGPLAPPRRGRRCWTRRSRAWSRTDMPRPPPAGWPSARRLPGAHLHHFQTRQALVAAAMEHLAERRGENLLAAAENLPEGRERIIGGLDLLWSGYASPLYQAALDPGPTPAPTPTCASGWSRSSAGWTAKPRTSRGGCSRTSPSVPGSSDCWRWLRPRCGASRCWRRSIPAAGATAGSGRYCRERLVELLQAL